MLGTGGTAVLPRRQLGRPVSGFTFGLIPDGLQGFLRHTTE